MNDRLEKDGVDKTGVDCGGLYEEVVGCGEMSIVVASWFE